MEKKRRIDDVCFVKHPQKVTVSFLCCGMKFVHFSATWQGAVVLTSVHTCVISKWLWIPLGNSKRWGLTFVSEIIQTTNTVPVIAVSFSFLYLCFVGKVSPAVWARFEYQRRHYFFYSLRNVRCPKLKMTNNPCTKVNSYKWKVSQMKIIRKIILYGFPYLTMNYSNILTAMNKFHDWSR